MQAAALVDASSQIERVVLRASETTKAKCKNKATATDINLTAQFRRNEQTLYWSTE
ncbi:hypothetical protein [Paraburkholderia sediminicola]|uniref:hypothetical protein n=1 Tax=Paraburkholderia sediminicola TaxID=458836 RepID=UPI0038BDB0BA